MKYGFLFLLLVFDAFGTQLQVGDSPGALVDEVVQRFEKISESSADLLEKLKLIKESTAAFLKLSYPLGALLAASLDIVHKPESDEYKALKNLSSEMHYRFDRLDERITDAFTQMKADKELREFDDFVSGPLNTLGRHIRRFLDPTIQKHADAIKAFVSRCTGNNGVEEMAHYVYRHVVLKCQLNNTFVFVEMEKILYFLVQEHEIRREWTREELHLKQKIEDVLYSIPSATILPELEKLQEEVVGYSSFEQALTEIYSFLKPLRPRDPSRCLTDTVFNSNKYDRDAINGYSDLIQYELSRLMIATTVCGNISYANSTEYLDEFILEVGNDIVATSQFLVNYIPRKLNMSAFGAEETVVKSTIAKYLPEEKGDIPVEHYSKLAERLGVALKHIGPAGIIKQFMVSHPDDNYYNTFYVCPPYWCSLVLKERGVNVMISRFERDRAGYVFSLKRRREHIYHRITAQLKTDYWIPLSQLVTNLKSQQNVSLVVDFERSAAIVRHKTAAPDSCSFSSRTHAYIRRRGGSRKAIVEIRHHNFPARGTFDDNSCHHFFFMM